jgi:hypothetical protein
MTEQQRADYLLKQREARQQKRFATDSIKSAQASSTGIANDLTTKINGILPMCYYSETP